MPCCLLALALMVPRITFVVMLLGGYAQRALDGLLWPLLGFLFMPFTLCAYVIGMNENGGITGWSMILLIVAVVIDIGGHGGMTREPVRTRTVQVIHRRR